MSSIYLPDDDELRRHPLARKGWELKLLVDDSRRRLRTYHATPSESKRLCIDSTCSAKAWVHEIRTTRAVYRDVPQAGNLVQLRVTRRRLKCSRCGRVFVERPEDLDRHLHITKALLIRVRSDLGQVESYSSIAKRYGLSVSLAKKIETVIVRREDEKREAKINHNDPTAALPRHIGLHSVRISKADCCLLTHPESGSVWELVSSQKPKEITETIDRLYGRSTFDNVLLVSIPPDPAYRNFVKEIFPGAKILVPKYYLKVMVDQCLEETIARDAWSLNAEELESLRSLVFANRRRLSRQHQNRLERLENLTPTVGNGYGKKELFLKVLSAGNSKEARIALTDWCTSVWPVRAVRNDFDPLISTVKSWEQEICEAFDHKVKESLAHLNQIIERLDQVGRGYSPQTVRGRLLYLLDQK